MVEWGAPVHSASLRDKAAEMRVHSRCVRIQASEKFEGADGLAHGHVTAVGG